MIRSTDKTLSPMKILFFTTLLLSAATGAICQKAYPIEIGSFLDKIPIPRTSVDCYQGSTRSTDPSTGSVTIKDDGPAFQSLLDQFDKISRAAVGNAMGANMSAMSATPPTADQIEQMKQQAMAKAAQTQTTDAQQMARMYNNPSAAASRPGQEDVQLMKLIGEAQNACGRLNQLSVELNTKVNALDKSAISNIRTDANCPDVRQGSYAGPTCACLIEHAVSYETKRVDARNAWLKEITALLVEYEGKMRPLIAIVDNAVAKAKYGDALSNPAFKQQVPNIQLQALNAVTALTALANGSWKDGAKQYVRLVNANSGASVGCYGHK
jgi:hypothetical protein